MKRKVFSMLVLISFMSGNVFAGLNWQQDNGCNEYAILGVIMEQVAFDTIYTDEEADEARNWYYGACMEVGGAENIDQPIFL